MAGVIQHYQVVLHDSPFTADVEAHLPHPSTAEREALIARIKVLLLEKNAVLVVHYYVHADLQRLAEESGGYVSDSLDMARFGHEHPASTLVVAGVRFMGETAKILNPEKRVLMPTLEAECSLDLDCPANRFVPFCDAHPDREVVVYSNTSAAVKARADWVVTSSIAVPLVEHLHAQGRKILWAPDKHLGNYIQRTTGADMLIWDGRCVVHEEFKASAMREYRDKYPDAGILVHPESASDVIALADAVGSTSQLIEAARKLPHKRFIVATDNGIFYKMKQAAPEKEFIVAPSGGTGASCKSCGHCPWMAMNDLTGIAHVLETGANEITIPEDIRVKALRSTQRMLDFAARYKRKVLGSGSA